MPGSSFFRSFTRLIVGGVLNSLDGIANRLETWEQEIDSPEAYPVLTSGLDASAVPLQPAQGPAQNTETHAELATYALVGLLFHSQERLQQYTNTAGRATRVIGNWGDLLGGSVYRSRLFTPVRKNLNRFAQRGEQQVDGWIATGRSESIRGRRLASEAVTERVDNAIEYLTGNEEVQELVQSQSVSLVDEVIEETRERTVSADDFLEAIVRSVFRRPPRWELPETPPQLKSVAEEHTHPIHTRPIHR